MAPSAADPASAPAAPRPAQAGIRPGSTRAAVARPSSSASSRLRPDPAPSALVAPGPRRPEQAGQQVLDVTPLRRVGPGGRLVDAGPRQPGHPQHAGRTPLRTETEQFVAHRPQRLLRRRIGRRPSRPDDAGRPRTPRPWPRSASRPWSGSGAAPPRSILRPRVATLRTLTPSYPSDTSRAVTASSSRCRRRGHHRHPVTGCQYDRMVVSTNGDRPSFRPSGARPWTCCRGVAILGTLATNIWIFTNPEGLIGYLATRAAAATPAVWAMRSRRSCSNWPRASSSGCSR